MTNETMQALVLAAPGTFSIERVEIPRPGPFEVRCRVRAVSICGTDAHLIAGDYDGFWPPSFPFVPGHEWAGDVVELGEGADALGWAIGDRAAGTSHAPCGFCQQCVEGRYNICENYGVARLHAQYGHNAQGAYATYAVHSARSVFRLPDELDYDVGAVLDPASIALHTAVRGNIRPGDTVVVLGPGPVGLLAADAARALGAGRVMVIGRGTRLAAADALGNEAIDYTADEPVAAVRERTAGIGADVVLECAGVPDTFRQGVAMLRKGGRCAAVGIPVEEVTLALQDLVLYERELVGVRASAGEMRRVIPLVVDGRMRLEQLITHHFPLSDYAHALDVFTERRDGALKVIVRPGE